MYRSARTISPLRRRAFVSRALLGGDVELVLTLPHEGRTYELTAAWSRLDPTRDLAVMVLPIPLTGDGLYDYATYTDILLQACNVCVGCRHVQQGGDDLAAAFWADAAERLSAHTREHHGAALGAGPANPGRSTGSVRLERRMGATRVGSRPSVSRNPTVTLLGGTQP